MSELFRVGGFRGIDNCYWVVAPDGREVYSDKSHRECVIFAETMNMIATKILNASGKPPEVA